MSGGRYVFTIRVAVAAEVVEDAREVAEWIATQTIEDPSVLTVEVSEIKASDK